MSRLVFAVLAVLALFGSAAHVAAGPSPPAAPTATSTQNIGLVLFRRLFDTLEKQIEICINNGNIFRLFNIDRHEVCGPVFESAPLTTQGSLCSDRSVDIAAVFGVDPIKACCAARTQNNGAGYGSVLSAVTPAGLADQIKCQPGLTSAISFPMFSGYITVDTDIHMHYNLVFPKNNTGNNAFAIHLQGGPGGSGYQTMYASHGPFRIMPNQNKETQEGHIIVNPYSKNENSYVVYVDSPVGIGFSYTSGDVSKYLGNDAKTTAVLYEFMQKLIERFPELRTKDLYVTGSSYSGHTVPDLAKRIMEKNIEGVEPAIQLRGVLAGNALIDNYGTRVSQIAKYFYDGSIPLKAYEDVTTNCFDGYLDHYKAGNDFDASHGEAPNGVYWKKQQCQNAVVSATVGLLPTALKYASAAGLAAQHSLLPRASAQRKTFEKEEYDRLVSGGLLRMTPEEMNEFMLNKGKSIEFAGWQDYLNEYMNRDDVQQNLHVNSTWTYFPITGGKFLHNTYNQLTSAGFRYDLEDNFDRDMAPVLNWILANGQKVTLISGTSDTQVSHVATQYVLKYRVGKNVVDDFKPWWRSETPDQSGGYVQKFKENATSQPITFVTVRDGGHNIAQNNPQAYFDFWNRYIKGEFQ